MECHRCGIAGAGENLRGAHEEYAYDALGRRVWLRSRRDHWCAGSLTSGRCLGAVQRTVWDGQQVLAEIRYPGNNYELPDSMERDTSTLKPINRDPCIINCPPPTDTSPSHAQFYGRVLYTHGMGIDAPLWLMRVGYYSQGANSVTVTPLVNWRAQYDTGASSLPIQAWPGYWTEARLLDRERDVEMPHWVGSLVEQGRDGTGQLYRRNRYYDPGTGRFTQEDPIGLAGGLNLYGYANGDPVNFSDPFGLCPPEDNNITDCPGFFTAIGAATGALLGGLGGGTGGAALCVPGGPALAACGAAGGAAGWISGGAAGARLGAWADVAIFASKQAKAVETAEAHRSGPRGVNKHMDLIRGDPGAQDAIHHAGEVRGMLKTIERMAGRMQGRTQEQWRQWIRTTQRELDRLMSGR